MSEKRSNLQEQFLNAIRKQKAPVDIFLINSKKLDGVVTSYDNFCVLLRKEGKYSLVYKHVISTIAPSVPITLHVMDDEV